MHSLALLSQFVENHLLLTYLVIFLGVMLEGELTLLFSGVFAHIGIIPMPDTLYVAFLGAAAKTVFGYSTGALVRHHVAKNAFLNYIERNVLHFLPHLSERPFWSIFASKFIYGVNNFTVIFAGYIKTPLKTFLSAEALSSVILVPLVFGLGYFFSYAAFALSSDVKKVGLILLLFLIGFIFLQKIVNAAILFFEELD